MRVKPFIISSFLLLGIAIRLHAQFSLGTEIRPRFEIRNGFRQLRDSSSEMAGLISQRSRISVGYNKGIIASKISFQDVRVWGDEKLKQDIPSLALHEAWVNLKLFDSLSIKVGRQELSYDNQRLLGSVNWLQQAQSHDAAVLKFHSSNWTCDFGSAFNQTSDTILSDTYYSLTKSNYKFLEFLWATRKFDKFLVSGVFIADGYQKVKDTVNTRYTYGLVAKYSSSLSADFRVFLQNGKTVAGQTIQALYLNADIGLKARKTNPLVGFEYFSGNDNSNTSDSKYRAFNNLYGTAHKFNGNMEYFTKPESTKNAGLIDIYAKCSYRISGSLAVEGDYHYFSLPDKYVKPSTTSGIDKYLASELDLSLNATLSNDATFNCGYSLLKAGNSLAVLQGHGDVNKLNQWFFIMLTVKPKLL